MAPGMPALPERAHRKPTNQDRPFVMRLVPKIPLALALVALCTPAWATVYKCVDADGRVTYTNDRSLARGCTALSQDQPVSSVPAPARRATGTPQPGQPSTSPSAFPRVSPDAQRARDDTRRQILETELASEEKALSEAQAALAEQESIRSGDERNYQRVLDRLQPFKDQVELHQRNIEALRKEIGTLR